MVTATAESDAARDRLFAEIAAWVRANELPRQLCRYGSHPEQVAELRLPDGPGPHPVVALVHGGNWRSVVSRASTAALGIDLVNRGWATLNIEYRRVGNGGGGSVTMSDVTEALRLVDNFAMIDGQRLVLLGHSSGGQLVLRAAQGAQHAAVVSMAGYCDLREAARLGLGDDCAIAFCGGRPEVVPESYDEADPMAHLPLGATTLLAHGTDDDRVPVQQSTSYAAAAERAGEPCDLMLFQGAGHFDFLDPRNKHWQAIAAALPHLLDARRPGPRRET